MGCPWRETSQLPVGVTILAFFSAMTCFHEMVWRVPCSGVEWKWSDVELMLHRSEGSLLPAGSQICFSLVVDDDVSISGRFCFPPEPAQPHL